MDMLNNMMSQQGQPPNMNGMSNMNGMNNGMNNGMSNPLMDMFMGNQGGMNSMNNPMNNGDSGINRHSRHRHRH